MPATLADIQKEFGDMVYPLYKEQMHEPYMENPKPLFGYQGVVLYSESIDSIQCNDCGGWYKSLPRHITQIHKYKDSSSYKNKFGLFSSVPLVSKKLSQIHSESATRHYLRNNKLVKRGQNWGNYKGKTNGFLKMQHKNKHNLCPAQISARLYVVRDLIKAENISQIESKDIRKWDYRLYIHLREKYGSVGKACEALKITQSRKDFYEDGQLIGLLRKFVIENKRIPQRNHTRNDFSNGVLPTEKVFRRVFGSWRRAKTMAGLSQLLAEIK